MRRWRPTMPRFSTPIVIKRAHDGPSARIGNQRTGSNIARVVKRFDTVVPGLVDKPSVAPPPTHTTLPGTYATGWTAWWPSPPSSTVNPYKIPDPPVIPRPVLPNADDPILWEAYAEVGSEAIDWELRISAVYVMAEWMPQTGKEKMSGMRDLSISEAALKIRPSIVSTANITTKEWNVIKVSDNTVWKLEAMVPSFRREEFVELMVERVE